MLTKLGNIKHIAINIFSLILIFIFVSQLNISADQGLTGYVTALEAEAIKFNPYVVAIFITFIVTLSVNLFFMVRE